MRLPDYWGKGSLFAYSGLEGVCSYSDSITGTLCGDRIGILFHTNARRELYFDFCRVRDFEFEIVASDMIKMKLKDSKWNEARLIVLFHSQDTVAGITNLCAPPVLECEKPCSLTNEDDVAVYHTKKDNRDEFSAFGLMEKGNEIVFAVSFSSVSAEAALKNVLDALNTDIYKEVGKKLDFFRELPAAGGLEPDAEKALYRCFSVLKSQVYSPEGIFKTRWTTPDRLPHKNLWLWDSVFHSLGNVYISRDLAFESLMAVLCSQREDGFIPLMAAPPDIRTEVTQPPLLAWGFSRFYMSLPDRNSVKEYRIDEIYKSLEKYLKWNMENRDSNKNLVYEWKISRDSVSNRCGECGMDNSSRFDNVVEMECIDFSCFMANEARSMARLAELAGRPAEASWWDGLYEKMKKAVNEFLWDEDEGFYYDRIMENGRFKKVKAVSSFLPLFAGICDERQAERLVRHLTDEKSFNTELPIPSIAVNEPSYEPDMWRGPVWLNYNYMVVQGLKEYGYKELAARLTDKTVRAVAFWYMHDGCIYEYFDAKHRISPARLNRKGRNLNPYDFRMRIQNVRDFGWTAALFVALVMESMI